MTPWKEAGELAREFASCMAADAPDRYTASAAKSKRTKRIFIDYLRNGREATVVAPYSTRARSGAQVSVPISRPELGALKSAHQYTVRNLAVRLKNTAQRPAKDD